MGILSSVIKGVSRAAQVIRDLPGKINRWDLSRDIRKSKTNVTVPDITPQYEPVTHKKRRVPVVNPPAPSDAVADLQRTVAQIQKQNAVLLEALQNGGKIGNAPLSNDPEKREKQLKYAVSIKESEETGEPPVVVYDSPDEEYRDVEELTDVEQQSLNQGKNPWFSPQ